LEFADKSAIIDMRNAMIARYVKHGRTCRIMVMLEAEALIRIRLKTDVPGNSTGA